MPPRPPIRASLPSRLAIPASKRTFLTSLLSAAASSASSSLPAQTLSATRRLPYNHKALYTVIADIDSYSSFLPYCSVSRVTSWTPSPDPEFKRRWPTRADLTAGWSGFEQTYTSRVLCIPGSIVEALSGKGVRSGIPAEILAKYGLKDDGNFSSSPATHKGTVDEEGVFKMLVTRWTVTPAVSVEGATPNTAVPQGQDWSDVHLNIRFQFANPVYVAASLAVVDKIAPVMIEAFVDRANKVLGP
ncbi:hypothetical protein F5Y16DRAFT_390515 [Xylariaceae sp. FL0255]|nr:hypothetical protein F5Y16DRAFT_390515 [Xylariaceae sp. FL0255]